MPLRVVSARKGGVEAEEGETIVYVARPHVLGNPVILHSEADRDSVIRQYEWWLLECMDRAPNNPRYRALAKLRKQHLAGKRIALQCWCAPKACHADVIKRVVEDDSLWSRE